jgi:hypothetical protein
MEAPSMQTPSTRKLMIIRWCSELPTETYLDDALLQVLYQTNRHITSALDFTVLIKFSNEVDRTDASIVFV